MGVGFGFRSEGGFEVGEIRRRLSMSDRSFQIVRCGFSPSDKATGNSIGPSPRHKTWNQRALAFPTSSLRSKRFSIYGLGLESLAPGKGGAGELVFFFRNQHSADSQMIWSLECLECLEPRTHWKDASTFSHKFHIFPLAG